MLSYLNNHHKSTTETTYFITQSPDIIGIVKEFFQWMIILQSLPVVPFHLKNGSQNLSCWVEVPVRPLSSDAEQLEWVFTVSQLIQAIQPVS